MIEPSGLPTLIRVEDFAKETGLSKNQAYDLASKMPAGVVVKLGRRVRLNRDRLANWLENGGSLIAKKSGTLDSEYSDNWKDDEELASL